MEGRLLQGHVQRLHNTLGECSLPSKSVHQQCFCRLVIHSWKFFLVFHLLRLRWCSTVGGYIYAFISVSLEHWWLSDGEPLCSSFDLILSIYITAAFMVRIFQSRNYVIVLLTTCICALSTGGSGLLPSPFHSLCDCSWNCISFFQMSNCRNNFVAKPSLRKLLEDHETKWVVGNKPAFPQHVLVLEWHIWICRKVFVWDLIFHFHVNADRLDQQQF